MSPVLAPPFDPAIRGCFTFSEGMLALQDAKSPNPLLMSTLEGQQLRRAHVSSVTIKDSR